jgi:hypothetical protein
VDRDPSMAFDARDGVDRDLLHGPFRSNRTGPANRGSACVPR